MYSNAEIYVLCFCVPYMNLVIKHLKFFIATTIKVTSNYCSEVSGCDMNTNPDLSVTYASFNFSV